MSYNNPNSNENTNGAEPDAHSNNPLSNPNAPMGVPDILQIGQPLDRVVDVELETNLLDPVSHNYASANGGQTTWVFPAKGVLQSQNAALVFELNSTGVDRQCAYPFWAGGLSCIRRATLRCGGVIISQSDRSALYGCIKSNMKYDMDEKIGVLDARHKSSSNALLRVAPVEIATGSANASFHQIYNPECDQVNSFGKAYNAGAANAHVQQNNKQLLQTAGDGPEVVIRLRDLFEIFDMQFNLPLFAMAQCELVIEWNASGSAAVAAANIIDCSLIETNPVPATAGARAQQCIATMVTPTLMLDYILYDEVERQKIANVINSPQGLRLSFLEVLHTRGINPEASAATAAGGAGTAEVIQSNHIIGMAGKEVHKIYVAKQYDVASGRGATEIDSLRNQVATHRNVLNNQFKSTEIIGEKYNFVINNNRVYSDDVDNKAIQHNYLSQCSPKGFNTIGCYYNTQNYDLNKVKELLDTSWAAKVATTNATQGRTQRYLAGSQHVIGLNLAKDPSLGPIAGNGQRISSAPIEYNYSRVALNGGGAGLDMMAAINLDFYICYRKNLVITPLGVNVGDA